MKNARLLINNNKEIIVRGYNLSEKKVIEFVTKYVSWVDKTIKKQNTKTRKFDLEKYQKGEIIWILGNKYKIVRNIDDNKLTYYIDKNILYTNRDEKIKIEQIFDQVKSDYQYYIEDLVKKYQKIFNIRPLVVYKDIMSKLGYCEYKHNKLVFSKRIIHIPIEAIEYVVVHEFCHFIVPNHSKKFYLEVEKYLPLYKLYMKKMKEYSPLLRY